jgi:hypothetical protein
MEMTGELMEDTKVSQWLIDLGCGRLQEWAQSNEPEEKLIYAKGYWEQIMFVRDRICINLLKKSTVEVISTHRSKSVCLPVYKISWNGFTFIMRYNFYDWKISVEAPYQLKGKIDFLNLFDENKDISSCYCEGFPTECVFPCFSKNDENFTIELYDDYKVFTFFWILSQTFK